MIDLIPAASRPGLAAALAEIEGDLAHAAGLDAQAEKARATAAQIRDAASHPELEHVSATVPASEDRLDALMQGAAPAPPDHRQRAKVAAANEERSAVRRQMLVDADALEERAGHLHAKAAWHRTRADEARARFIQQATDAVQVTLKEAMRQLVLGPVLILVALKAEAGRAGIKAPGSIGLALDCIRLGVLDPARGVREFWPARSETLVTGDRFDPVAGYAQLISAIHGPADASPAG
jgi:hypothetical protein